MLEDLLVAYFKERGGLHTGPEFVSLVHSMVVYLVDRGVLTVDLDWKLKVKP